MIWCVFIVLTACKTVLLYFTVSYYKTGLRKIDPVITVGVCNMCASFLLIITFIWKLLPLFDSTKFELKSSDTTQTNSTFYVLSSKYRSLEYGFWMLATIFQSFTLLEFVISWLNALISLGNIFQENDFISEKTVKITIRIMNVTLLIFLLCLFL